MLKLFKSDASRHIHLLGIYFWTKTKYTLLLDLFFIQIFCEQTSPQSAFTSIMDHKSHLDAS